MSTSEAIQARLDWALEIARQAGEVTLQFFREPTLEVEAKGTIRPLLLRIRGRSDCFATESPSGSPKMRSSARNMAKHRELPVLRGCSTPSMVLSRLSMVFPCTPRSSGCLAHLLEISPKASPNWELSRPALDEVIYARRGGGAWHERGSGQPQQAQVDTSRSLAEGLLLTSEVGGFRKRTSGDGIATYMALDERARLARTWGDAYGYLMVATGRGDVMIDAEMNLWDAAALQPIIEEAGGVFCDWQGKSTVHSGEAIAGNAELVREVLAIVRGK